MERENLDGDAKGKDAMGGGENLAFIGADLNRWSPHAEVERPEPMPYDSRTGRHADRRRRDESVELARCRYRAWRRASTVEEARRRREHRRAKTDRLDTELLKRAFLGWLRGERDHCKMVAIPTTKDEDAKRPNRERESLVGEQTRIVNRMKATLIRLGIRGFNPKLKKAARHQRLFAFELRRSGHAARAGILTDVLARTVIELHR
jgi:hypothetical protein